MTRYTDSMCDIEIAQEALQQSLLTKAVLHNSLMCDVYSIPSHNHQAFYLQVYKGDDFVLLYAKTLVSDFYANHITMYTFAEALKAKTHIAKNGAIYCGIKHLPLDDPTITKLLQCLPFKKETCLADGAVIDGVCTIVRNYQCTPPAVVEYFDSKQIKFNSVLQENAEFMNDLYLHIEQILGNLLDTM